MNELAKQEQGQAQIALAPKTMDQAMEFAGQMAQCGLVPAHLQNKPADCFRVVLQAAQWEMNPFAVADCTSVISGKLMYEGKLVSAVVNARGGLKSRLNYHFDGTGENRVLTVTGTLRGEDAAREIKLTYAQAAQINKNGQMRSNPEQQMCYIGARIWARRHVPELMMGVYTPDEDYEEDLPRGPDTAKQAEIVDDQKGEDSSAEAPAKTSRPKAPAKAKGVAAARAAAKDDAIDVQPEPVTDEPDTDDPDKGDANTPEPEELDLGQADDPEPEPEPEAKPRTELNEGEKLEVQVVVTSVRTVKKKSDGSMMVLAEVYGPYEGKVFSDDTENEVWTENTTARLNLVGKKSAQGVVAWCEAASAV